MNLKEIRKKMGLKQYDFVVLLRDVAPEMDVPLLSKIERGICEPTEVTLEYAEKALANCLEQRKVINGVIVQNDLATLLNEPIYLEVFQALKKATVSNPLTKKEVYYRFGLDDRKCRRIMSDFRKAGIRVGTSSGHYGYWICNDQKSYEQLRNELKKRAMDILTTISKMDKYTEGQVEL